MKRTNQVNTMVEITNRMLKSNRTIDEFDSDVMFFQHLLLETRTYKGFNWFYDFKLPDGRIMQRLCGTSNHDELREMDGYLQFY